MRWKITIEGMDEFDRGQRPELVVAKDFGRLSGGDIVCPSTTVK
jgi:hypothetical protein